MSNLVPSYQLFQTVQAYPTVCSVLIFHAFSRSIVMTAEALPLRNPSSQRHTNMHASWLSRMNGSTSLGASCREVGLNSIREIVCPPESTGGLGLPVNAPLFTPLLNVPHINTHPHRQFFCILFFCFICVLFPELVFNEIRIWVRMCHITSSFICSKHLQSYIDGFYFPQVNNWIQRLSSIPAVAHTF